ncbi:hypothetical protein [Pandoraea sp. NPDC090278]
MKQKPETTPKPISNTNQYKTANDQQTLNAIEGYRRKPGDDIGIGVVG